MKKDIFIHNQVCHVSLNKPVVFTCGALRKKDGTIVISYCGDNTVMNVAFSHEDVLAELIYQSPPDPLTGLPGDRKSVV